MSWWSELLRRLGGRQDGEAQGEREAESGAAEDGPPVFECQVCFKVFESEEQRPACPECDSTEVKALTS
jgi:hypothetical protein